MLNEVESKVNRNIRFEETGEGLEQSVIVRKAVDLWTTIRGCLRFLVIHLNKSSQNCVFFSSRIQLQKCRHEMIRECDLIRNRIFLEVYAKRTRKLMSM